MIFIDVSKLNIPQEWLEKAKRLTDELMRINDPGTRAEFITHHAALWQELKKELEAISFNKCWYCEAQNIRGDLHVDHYRPKIRVKDKDGIVKTGYWWLAFNYNNFRAACSYCNTLHSGEDETSRGKIDHFPLLDESKRASSPDDTIEDEMPLLLDPTNPCDPFLLWFADDGRAISKVAKEGGFFYERAIVTMDILNLNDVKIVEARKKLRLECTELIERGDKAFARYAKGSISGKTEFEGVILQIRKKVQPTEQFSATSYAFFRGSAFEWVRVAVP